MLISCADQLRGYRASDLQVSFAYAKRKFSHDKAHIISLISITIISIPKLVSVAVHVTLCLIWLKNLAETESLIERLSFIRGFEDQLL